MNRAMTARVSIPIIAMLFLVLISAQAQAKGLLMFNRPVQYVDVSYQFIKNDASTIQRLTPSYGISVPFAILDPTFLLGTIGGSVKYDLDSASGASSQSSLSSGLGYTYNVNGILLKDSATPVSFFANSTENTTQFDFAPTSTDSFNSYGLSGIIRHQVLPLNYSYQHGDTTTDSGNGSFRTVQDSYNVNASNNYRNFMMNSVNAVLQQNSFTSNSAATSNSMNQFSLTLNNTLLLRTLSKRLGTFTSSLFIQNIGGTLPGDSIMLTETYDGSLGPGLLLGLSYTLGRTGSDLQTEHINAGQGFLEHRLFSSLRTRLSGNFNDTTFSTGGSNTVYSGNAQVTYTKKLPYGAVLQLEVGDGITVQDTKLNKSLQTRLNESVTVAGVSELYPLKSPGVTQVTDVFDKNHIRKFVTPDDYGTQVIGQITYITINPAGGIHSGDVILVSYEFQADPSIKYSTTTLSTSGSYTLFDGRYLFQVQYSESNSTLSGQGLGTFSPPESKLFRAAARANLHELIFGVEYRNTENFATKQETIEGFTYYYTIIGLNTLGLQASDSFDQYSTTTTGGGPSSSLTGNTLTVGGNWSRPLFLTGRMLLTTNYQMVRGSLPSRDYLSARFAYDLPLGKFRLHLDASSVLRMVNTGNSTNNYVNLSVRRYF